VPKEASHNYVYYHQLLDAQVHAIKAPRWRFSCCLIGRQVCIVVVAFSTAHRSPESEIRTAVILLFRPLDRVTYLPSTLTDQFELNRAVCYRVVLLGNVCEYMRWDVLHAGRLPVHIILRTQSGALIVPTPLSQTWSLYSERRVTAVYQETWS
jgi:hypothetical protein